MPMRIKDKQIRTISYYNPTSQRDEVVQTERLHSGEFCTAYLDKSTNDVFIFMNVEKMCPGKEILTFCDPSGHIPPMLHVDDTEVRSTFKITEYRVWRTTFSGALQARSKKAWAQYKTLKKAWEVTLEEMLKNHPHKWNEPQKYFAEQLDFDDMVMPFLDLLQMWNVDADLVKDLSRLYSVGSMYGASMWWEFAPRNLGVSDTGELVLRDIALDREILAKMRQRK